MTVARIGRYLTSHSTFVSSVLAGQQRAYVADATSQTIIVYRLGAYMGRTLDGGTSKVRLAIGATSGTAPDPSTRLAYTSELSLTTAMDESSGGSVVTNDITPIVCPPGIYALAIAAASADCWVDELTAAEISSRNEQLYTKSVGSNVPTDPIGGSPEIEGHLGIWAEGDVNVAPNTPINLAPSGTVTGGDLTPSMEGDYRDANETLSNGVAWDKLTASQILVTRNSDGHVMWNYTEASGPIQQADRRTQITYNGEALAVNVLYTFKLRQQDRAGAWSNWASTTFTIAGGASVGPATAPSGKQTTNMPGPFVAPYTHQTGLSTSAVQVRLFLDGQPRTNPFAVSGTIAKTVASGANISITWAESGFTPLTWGQKYWAEIRAQDTASNWSDWSNGTSFTPDAPPSVPSQLSPANGAVVTAYPLLTCVATDADNDSTNGLVVKARIKNSSGTILFTRSMTYNATLSRWQYQTTGTDLASYATYRWDAYSGDGILWSGSVTSEASAVASGEVTFAYAQGPAISGQSPADAATITVSNPALSWTTTDQQKLRVQVWLVNGDGSTGVQVYDSGTITSTTSSWTMPSHILRNGNTYEWTVTVTNSAPLSGTSAPIRFTLTMTPPATVAAFTATPVRLGTDATETSILLTWDASTYSTDVFEGYDLWRTALGPDGVTPVGTPLWLRHITSPLQTAFLDGEPASGVLYQYSLTQTIRDDLDDLTSDEATQQASVAFAGVVLSNVLDPETYHVDLRFSANSDEGQFDFGQDLKILQPFGARLGQAVRGAYQAWNPSGNFALITDGAATAQQRLDALRTLAELGGTICYRDGRGTVRYVVLTKCTLTLRRILRYDVALGFTEIQWTPGETAVSA